MNETQPTPPAAVTRTRHWLLFLAGILLVCLGPAVYIARFRSKHLDSPWYIPVLATAGVAVMALSVWRRRGVLRIILLVLFGVVCAFEWHGLLVGTKNPAYTGPAQPGRKVPEFAAALADGTPFTEKDLEKGTPTVLVFYRGRW
jgi:hypothetical protein